MEKEIYQFTSDLADPIELEGIISIFRMDTDDFLYEKKDFQFINDALHYITS